MCVRRDRENAIGIESLGVVLETSEGELSALATETVGNALIAEIPNAVLAVPEGDSFEQFDPAEGIALVSVTGLPGDRVRVSITGTDTPPEAQVSAEAGNLVLSVAPGAEGAAGAEEEAIQVVVTGEQDAGYCVPSTSVGTRTDTPILDVPASVQVVPRQVTEDQGATDLNEALRNVSGVVKARNPRDIFSGFTIRGFDSDNTCLRNGIPDNDAGRV
jgi:iron complex outermembrane receptor protein